MESNSISTFNQFTGQISQINSKTSSTRINTIQKNTTISILTINPSKHATITSKIRSIIRVNRNRNHTTITKNIINTSRTRNSLIIIIRNNRSTSNNNQRIEIIISTINCIFNQIRSWMESNSICTFNQFTTQISQINSKTSSTRINTIQKNTTISILTINPSKHATITSKIRSIIRVNRNRNHTTITKNIINTSRTRNSLIIVTGLCTANVNS